MKLFNRICDAATQMEKRLPDGYHFMIYPRNTDCCVALMEESETFIEEIEGGYFRSVRDFKVYFKSWCRSESDVD